MASVASFSSASTSTRTVSTILAASGSFLLATSQATPLDWSKAAIQNASLLSLVLTVPLLASILSFESYTKHLTVVTSRFMTSPFRFYAITSLMTTTLSSLLNLASLQFVHQLLRPIAGKCPPALFSRALFRGFMPNVTWSPSFISVALATQYAGISWFALAPIGITLAVAGILCSLLFGWIEYGQLPDFPADHSPTDKTLGMRKQPEDRSTATRKLLELLVQIGLLISMIVFLEYSTKKSALVLVPLISFTGPMFLAKIYGKSATYSLQFRDYIANKLSKMYNEPVLFSAIGFFGYSLAISDFSGQISLFISRFGLDTPLKLLVLIIASIGCLSFIGIHPMISIAGFAAAMPPGGIPLSDSQLAGAFMIGYMFYGISSPFSAITLIMSSLTKQNPLSTGIFQNGIFTLTYLILSIAIILLLFPVH